ncbi:hypothetical protein BBJ28_00001034 [Nothophytophthora sp. Chile5]|nr:hypothetical protein BBJ28_00001034 [Nothophytophthora sp. Chile5]
MVKALHIRTLTALAAVASISAEHFEGDGTAYTLSEVSSGNCNFMSAISVAPTNYAALNQVQWDDLANCGRCAEVSCIDEACVDQTATSIVQILDRCPECNYGDLDLSPTVFKTITGSDPSRLKIRWQFVDCPNPGNVEICVKSGSGPFWMAVQPTNTVVGVETVTINGRGTTMLNGAYYFLLESSSPVDLAAARIVITSVNGDKISGTYSLMPGQCLSTNQQFESSPLTIEMPTPTTPAPTATLPLPTEAPTTTSAPTTATPTTTPASSGTTKCHVRSGGQRRRN